MTTIELTAFQAGEMDQAFDIYKAELSAVVDEAFGWDEAFQRGRFFERYHSDWFEWAAVDGQRIGYVCSHRTDIEIHVSLLIVLKKFQGLGYGAAIMEQIHRRAAEAGLRVGLSSFKSNGRAIRFYQKLGYRISGEDSNFVDMMFNRRVLLSNEIIRDVERVSAGRFSASLVTEFTATVHRLIGASDVLGAIVQVSTDEGDELEVGCFTATAIFDITLSRGNVYSYAYPLADVKSVELVDRGSKWTLVVQGEKKFDYNVVKPGSIDDLRAYETSLREQIKIEAHR